MLSSNNQANSVFGLGLSLFFLFGGEAAKKKKDILGGLRPPTPSGAKALWIRNALKGVGNSNTLQCVYQINAHRNYAVTHCHVEQNETSQRVHIAMR